MLRCLWLENRHAWRCTIPKKLEIYHSSCVHRRSSKIIDLRIFALIKYRLTLLRRLLWLGLLLRCKLNFSRTYRCSFWLARGALHYSVDHKQFNGSDNARLPHRACAYNPESVLLPVLAALAFFCRLQFSHSCYPLNNSSIIRSLGISVIEIVWTWRRLILRMSGRCPV